MRFISLIVAFFVFTSAHALSVDIGLGYSYLDLGNADGTKSRSTGLGSSLGVYYSVCGNENFDFGFKGSAFYSKMDNDINTAFLSEQTQHYNVGLGFELSLYNFFISWQHKYNRLGIELEGNLTKTSAFSDYMSQMEIGYIFQMERMSVRLVYQRTDNSISAAETGLGGDTDMSSSAFMFVLRFDLSAKRSHNNDDDWRSDKKEDWSQSPQGGEPSAISYRTYRYAPRPSPRIK